MLVPQTHNVFARCVKRQTVITSLRSIRPPPLQGRSKTRVRSTNGVKPTAVDHVRVLGTTQLSLRLVRGVGRNVLADTASGVPGKVGGDNLNA